MSIINEDDILDIKLCITGFLCVSILYGALYSVTKESRQPQKYIPAVSAQKIQPGYVVPSELEIKVRDLDDNGKKETFVKYKGKDYLFIVDEEGKPKLVSYEIRPVEIIPK